MRRAVPVEDALAECLDALRQGPDAFDRTLRRYPQYRSELASLVQVAMRVRLSVDGLAIPDWAAWAWAPLEPSAGKPPSTDRSLVLGALERLGERIHRSARAHLKLAWLLLFLTFSLLGFFGWLMVAGSFVALQIAFPGLQELSDFLLLAVLPLLFFGLVVYSTNKWLRLLVFSPVPPAASLHGIQDIPRANYLPGLGGLVLAWNSPVAGVRLLSRLTVWGLVRLVGLIIIINGLMPLLQVANR
jgi:hypothetical protein